MFKYEGGQKDEALARLSAELERQADIYRGLGVNKDAIMRLLAPRPDRLSKYLDIPVVTLGTSVALERQAGFAGIETYYDLSRGYDVAGGITFGQPHLIWMHDGTRNLNKSVELVRNNLGKNDRPSTQYDGVAFGIVYPDFLKVLRSHAIDLPGTAVESVSAPYFYDRHGKPGLSRHFVGGAYPDYGSALSGS